MCLLLDTFLWVSYAVYKINIAAYHIELQILQHPAHFNAVFVTRRNKGGHIGFKLHIVFIQLGNDSAGIRKT